MMTISRFVQLFWLFFFCLKFFWIAQTVIFLFASKQNLQFLLQKYPLPLTLREYEELYFANADQQLTDNQNIGILRFEQCTKSALYTFYQLPI
jgi:hypothetical protein